jgi:hypothetical protein
VSHGRQRRRGLRGRSSWLLSRLELLFRINRGGRSLSLLIAFLALLIGSVLLVLFTLALGISISVLGDGILLRAGAVVVS